MNISILSYNYQLHLKGFFMSISITSRAEQALSLEHTSKFCKYALSDSYASYKATLLKVEHLRNEVALGNRLGFFEHPQALAMIEPNEMLKNAVIELLHDLSSTDELELLEVDNQTLYDYRGNNHYTSHARIHHLVTRFMQSLGNIHNYNLVIKIAKKIHKSEGYDLNSVALEFGLKNLEMATQQLIFHTSTAEKDHVTRTWALRISCMKAEEFIEGDFSFVADVDTRVMFDKAYKFLSHSGALEQEVISDQTWDRFAEANYDLSGHDILLCQAQIRSIKTKGWHEHVNDYIAFQKN